MTVALTPVATTGVHAAPAARGPPRPKEAGTTIQHRSPS